MFNKIVAHLYLGDLQDYNSITNMSKPYLFVDARPFYNLLQGDADGRELMVTQLKALAISLAELVKVGVDIYVYCQAGMERSPFLTALILSELNRGTLDECYYFVKTKRPQTMIYDVWVRTMETEC